MEETALIKKQDLHVKIGRTKNNEYHMDVLNKFKASGPLAAVAEAATRAVLICVGKVINDLDRAAGRVPCPYRVTCIFCNGESDLEPPVGEPCPIEASMYEDRFNGYCEMVVPQRENLSLLSLVNEITSLEIYIIRLQTALARKPELVEDQVVGVDKEGNAVEARVVSQELKEYQNALKLKLSLFREMGLTPKSRAQIGSTLAKDPSTYAAELVAAYHRIMSQKERDANEKRAAGPGNNAESSRVTDSGGVTELSPGPDGSWCVPGEDTPRSDDRSAGRSDAGENDAEIQDEPGNEPGHSDEQKYYTIPGSW